MGQTPVVVGGDASWIGEAVEDLRINDEQVEGEPQQWTCVKKMRRMGNNVRIQADSAQVGTLVAAVTVRARRLWPARGGMPATTSPSSIPLPL
jgi:hypothetical protein